VAALEFIDVVGMRAIADAARAASGTVKLRGASSALRRHWGLAGHGGVDPLVQLVA
jgi:hypothetical protein